MDSNVEIKSKHIFDEHIQIDGAIANDSSKATDEYVFTCDGGISKIALHTLTETTYSELKELRDNKELVPGMQYRITDYECTTSQEDTQSAGHQFDIIVVADDEETLNENARAIKHEGDTYFDNCHLEAWELKYSMDNDTDRFAWADNGGSSEGDKYEITFTLNGETITSVFESDGIGRKATPDVDNEYCNSWVSSDGNYMLYESYKTSHLFYKNNDKTGIYNIDTTNLIGDYTIISEKFIGGTEGKGVIFYMKDEWNNECPYDFKNIQFKDSNYENTGLESDEYYYTFTWIKFYDSSKSNYDVIDFSLGPISGFNFNVEPDGHLYHCIGNSIKEYINEGILYLSNNIFVTLYDNNCTKNIVGNNCKNNTFSMCSYTIIGNNCNKNVIGAKIIKTSASSFNIKLDYKCSENLIDGHGIILSEECTLNKIREDSSAIILGNRCSGNIMVYSAYCTIGNECHNIIFGSSETELKSRYYHIDVSPCNYNIYINCTKTLSTKDWLTMRYVYIDPGVNTLNSTYQTDSSLPYKTITIDEVGQTHKTTVVSNNAKTIVG